MPQRIVRRTVTEVEKTRKPETYAYLRSDISFALFAKEAEIPQRVLSRAINRQRVIEGETPASWLEKERGRQ